MSMYYNIAAVHAGASLTQVGERRMANAAEREGRLCLFVARSAFSLALQALHGTPQSEEVEKAVGKLVPQKSKDLYEKEYNIFCRWRDQKQAKGVDENIVLVYISERSTKVKSSSLCLWSYYSQLKKMLSVREKIDCSRFHQVTAFLKTASTGYVQKKKTRVFNTRRPRKIFGYCSYNEKYLLLKVVAIMGIAGGCRIGELVSMSVDDIDDREVRSSATLLADSAVDLSVLKIHGG
ncbi:hypothetical protein Zmor_006589 [Zophobas morio]|uniref:Uncharacterized protein n=1 Tax=Zophobas morio TaxID=2755281 RepID=A0AA38IQC9_9CUCU|nr:hypothetical protein Zmor_006589 [Zophobas morio]